MVLVESKRDSKVSLSVAKYNLNEEYNTQLVFIYKVCDY